jgi:hypothetical protein
MSADYPDQRPSPCDHDDEIAELRRQVAAHERALTDEVVRSHLEGRDTIGLYPLLVGDTCRLLVCDFDKSSWSWTRRPTSRWSRWSRWPCVYSKSGPIDVTIASPCDTRSAATDAEQGQAVPAP